MVMPLLGDVQVHDAWQAGLTHETSSEGLQDVLHHGVKLNIISALPL